MRPALFLDRDGVINHDTGYTHKWSINIINTEIIDLIKKFRACDFLIIIITNQSGIGRGYYSEIDFHKFMQKMFEYFGLMSAPIDDYFYCGCDPKKNYCNNRKPNPGMFFNAIKKYNINPRMSVMIGDKITDVNAAKKAGILNNYLYLKGAFEQKRNIDSENSYSIINSLSMVYLPKRK